MKKIKLNLSFIKILTSNQLYKYLNIEESYEESYKHFFKKIKHFLKCIYEENEEINIIYSNKYGKHINLKKEDFLTYIICRDELPFFANSTLNKILDYILNHIEKGNLNKIQEFIDSRKNEIKIIPKNNHKKFIYINNDYDYIYYVLYKNPKLLRCLIKKYILDDLNIELFKYVYVENDKNDEFNNNFRYLIKK